MLPPFVDSTHCLPYHLTKKGRAVADRVVSVLGYACPDITYSPSLYPITAILLHFMSGEWSLQAFQKHKTFVDGLVRKFSMIPVDIISNSKSSNLIEKVN